MSAVISVRLNDQEQNFLEQASESMQCKISTLLKELTFQKLEDEYDMHMISEYEKEKEAGTLELFSLDDVVKEIEG